MAKEVSRQRSWQLRRIKAGLCSICGKKREKRKLSRCDKCMEKNRERRRKSYRAQVSA